MKRSEKRTEARRKRMNLMKSLTERFYTEMDKEEPNEDGHLSTENALRSITTWLENLRKKYPQENSFFVEVGASWTRIFAQTCKQYALRRKKKMEELKEGGNNARE